MYFSQAEQIGFAISLLSLAGGGVMMLWPTRKIFGWFLIASGTVGLLLLFGNDLYLAYHESLPPRDGMVCGTLSAPVQAVVNSIGPDVGNQTNCPGVESTASIQQFQKAKVIFLDHPRSYITLREDLSWFLIKDDRECHVFLFDWCEQSTVQNTEHFKKLFGLESMPDSLHPPYGGMALYANEHPQEFLRNYGLSIWVCEIRNSGMLNTQYKHGFILSVLPQAPNDTHGCYLRIFFEC